ncbi:MAG: ABC transporter ATP-binding protein [Nitrospinota bacterium]
MNSCILEVRDLHTSYGSIRALRGVSLAVPQGALVSIIGANGAGKSTLLKTISGLKAPDRGSLLCEGEDIANFLPERVVARGISQVPEGRQVFGPLSVLENLELGAYSRKDREGVQKDLSFVFNLFPVLQERKGQLAGTLSGGEQQMLAIARALMARPRLLLLDEPSMGLAPMVVKEIMRVLKELHRKGTAILLVEQNARAALTVADYAYVLETGEVVLEGLAREVLENESVKEAYLGARPISPGEPPPRERGKWDLFRGKHR